MRYENLPSHAVDELKIRVLDSLGVAIAALPFSVPAAIGVLSTEWGRGERYRLIGERMGSAVCRVLQCALVRYLDFNDSILDPARDLSSQRCHRRASCFRRFRRGFRQGLSHRRFAFYQVQTALSEAAPVAEKGFDHTVQLGYAAAASLSKLLGDSPQIANAVSITGTANNPLRVSRTGDLSQWKGLAAPFTVFIAANSACLAREGITGPAEVFEGNKGFKKTIAGPFTVDWDERGLQNVTRSIIKRFNAEIHSQSALEAALFLKREKGFSPLEIQKVELETFDVAFRIIGGGEEGGSTRSNEGAGGSFLPYLLAVALLDEEVTPAQYEPERSPRPRCPISSAKDTDKTFGGIEPSISRRDAGTHRDHFERRQIVRGTVSDYEGFSTRP